MGHSHTADWGMWISKQEGHFCQYHFLNSRTACHPWLHLALANKNDTNADTIAIYDAGPSI